jgi:hypothetical protein
MAVASADAPQPLDNLSGIVERVAYFNEETGFAVLRGDGVRVESISTRDFRSSSEQLRRLFSLARSTCGAVQNILSLLF